MSRQLIRYTVQNQNGKMVLLKCKVKFRASGVYITYPNQSTCGPVATKITDEYLQKLGYFKIPFEALVDVDRRIKNDKKRLAYRKKRLSDQIRRVDRWSSKANENRAEVRKLMAKHRK